MGMHVSPQVFSFHQKKRKRKPNDIYGKSILRISIVVILQYIIYILTFSLETVYVTKFPAINSQII